MICELEINIICFVVEFTVCELNRVDTLKFNIVYLQTRVTKLCIVKKFILSLCNHLSYFISLTLPHIHGKYNYC